jgi:plastocyanin
MRAVGRTDAQVVESRGVQPVTRRLSVAVAAAALTALAFSSPALAVELRATVGPEFTISLTDASGNRVTQLDPGTYDIVVDDRSDFHNFFLSGPGVSQRTGVEFVGTTRWTVTFVEGRYAFVCDPHATMMRGAFVVGNPPPPPPPPPKVRRLQALVGPGFTVSVRTLAGARVTSTARGRVNLTVRDRSRAHNFHLIGPGINRRTSLAFVGTQTWQLTLRPGLYRFLCDPHALRMRGSFRVR